MAWQTVEQKVTHRRYTATLRACSGTRRIRGFFKHYQIDTSNEDNETDESESDGEGELVSTSYHSPLGFVMFVAEKTGWTKHEILHKVSFSELLAMLADAPGLKKKTKEKKEFQSDEELVAWLKG